MSRECTRSRLETSESLSLLGASWVVVSGVLSPLVWVVSKLITVLQFQTAAH